MNLATYTSLMQCRNDETRFKFKGENLWLLFNLDNSILATNFHIHGIFFSQIKTFFLKNFFFSNKNFFFSKTFFSQKIFKGVVESGVWSVESGLLSVESGVWSRESGVGSMLSLVALLLVFLELV